jgi:hypothetical protein
MKLNGFRAWTDTKPLRAADAAMPVCRITSQPQLQMRTDRAIAHVGADPLARAPLASPTHRPGL